MGFAPEGERSRPSVRLPRTYTRAPAMGVLRVTCTTRPRTLQDEDRRAGLLGAPEGLGHGKMLLQGGAPFRFDSARCRGASDHREPGENRKG